MIGWLRKYLHWHCSELICGRSNREAILRTCLEDAEKRENEYYERLEACKSQSKIEVKDLKRLIENLQNKLSAQKH